MKDENKRIIKRFDEDLEGLVLESLPKKLNRLGLSEIRFRVFDGKKDIPRLYKLLVSIGKITPYIFDTSVRLRRTLLISPDRILATEVKIAINKGEFCYYKGEEFDFKSDPDNRNLEMIDFYFLYERGYKGEIDIFR